MLIFLTIYSLISIRSEEKNIYQSTISRKNDTFDYTEEGFYSVLIHSGDKIKVFLNEGKDSLFFFIPYDPNFNIKDINVDGSSISIDSRPLGIAIEGNNSVTLTFNSTVNDIEIQSNFWIIPNNFCAISAASVYGNHIIDLHFKESKLCVFSPIFDSQSQKFKIESGIPFDYGDHFTSFYTINYQIPDFKCTDNVIETHSFETGNFVSFSTSKFFSKNLKISHSKSDDHHDSELLFYKRETKIKSSPYSQNSCAIEPVLRCTSEKCQYDAVNVVFKKCNEKGVNVTVIILASVGSVLFIVVLCLILFFVSKKNKKNEKMNTLLLNNEDEGGENEYTKSQN